MLNNKHRETLRLIFDTPIRGDVNWRDIEKLMVALGGEISEGNGSRVRLWLNGVRAVFHRPHPRPTTDKGALKSVRRFLENAGVRYDDL
ncbi:MAG: type II toxin-antitoxin system HicA family toxin [Verrucomicrobiales bacterium]|nr:type II toxin-antitoxin system HicA family toxin [Verrucomicrobiales bacterium]